MKISYKRLWVLLIQKDITKVGYDLSSNEKLKNFIPTKSSLGLLEEILLSTAETSTERSRGFDRGIWQRKVTYRSDYPLNPDETRLAFI